MNDKEVNEIKPVMECKKCKTKIFPYMTESKCGSSIEATNQECSFCHNKIKYLQEWILINK